MAPAPPTGPGKSTASWHADRADAIKTRLDSVGVGDNKAHNKPPEDALKGNGSARGGSGGGGGESASRKAPSADVAGDLLSGFSIYYYIFFYLLLYFFLFTTRKAPCADVAGDLLSWVLFVFVQHTVFSCVFPWCCVVFSLRCWCLLWFSPLSFVFLSFFFSLRCWCFLWVFPLSFVFPLFSLNPKP